MTTFRKTYRIQTAALGGIFASLLVLQACSGDDDPKPSEPPVIGKGGGGAAATGGRANSGGGGSTPGGAGEDAGGAGNSTGSGGAPLTTGGRAGDAGSAGTGPECTNPVGPGGCFACEPTGTDDLEFLNRCSDAQCAPFDNAERIPGWSGSLPDLD